MSKEKKNGHREGLWYEIIVMALLIGLSMTLGVRLYCKEWVDAFISALWIACWVVWYRIWKDAMRYCVENHHLKKILTSTMGGLMAIRHIMEENDEDDAKKDDGAEAGAQSGDSQAQEEK
jgi:hypothetical protein